MTLGSIDMSHGQASLAYNRIGNVVTVNTGASTTAGRYYELNELEGGTVDLGSSKYRRIHRNAPGVWTNAANHVLPNIEFDGLDSSEPASGTLDIWSPRILAVVHNVANVYTKFRITIPAHQTSTDDIRIGTLLIGPVYLFSQDYSWGRLVGTEPNTDVITYRDGSRSSFQRGKNRRRVTFGWGEGIDVTHLQGTSVNADYVMGTSTGGAKPVGYRGDMPSILSRLNAFTGGAHLPLVYCASIDAGSSGNDAKLMQGLNVTLYGRMVTGVQTDAIIGDELAADGGEVFRVATLQIEEEL